MASSPAGLLRVFNEQGAGGQVTERALHLTALNCVLAVFFYNAIVGIGVFQTSGNFGHAAAASLLVLGASALLGVVFGMLVPRWLRSRAGAGSDATLTFALAVLLLVAVTHVLSLSPVLAALSFGLVARHRRSALGVAQRNFGALGDLLSVLLFVFAASTLEWEQVGTGSCWACCWYWCACWSRSACAPRSARPSGISVRKGALSGLALAPMAVFAVLLIEQTRRLGVDLFDSLAPLAAIALLLQVLGPLITQRAVIGPTKPINTRRLKAWRSDPFASSESLTMGVELELQLVSLSDFDLVPASPDMLELLGRAPFPGNVTPEITESMIEINSSVHTPLHGTAGRAAPDPRHPAGGRRPPERRRVRRRHPPFQQWSQRRIYAKPRFHEVSQLYGYLAKQFTVFGQHVHIGCRSGDEAMYLLHALNRYVPHFIALSASSPFSQGFDTSFQSARLNSVFAFPLSGRAPFLLSWDAFAEDYFNRMAGTGIVRSMKDFYWDLRPKPEYGTIELRVCDTPLSVERAAALACYLQACAAICWQGNEPPPKEDDYLVYNYNRFQACRFGLDGTLVHPQTPRADVAARRHHDDAAPASNRTPRRSAAAARSMRCTANRMSAATRPSCAMAFESEGVARGHRRRRAASASARARP
jgi:carboxylate-amine ligase